MGQIIDRVPTNCQVEPPYPGLETIVFSLRDPSMTAHGVTFRCSIEHPHSTDECGEWAEWDGVTRSELGRHRDWCDYRLDVLKGISQHGRRACDCPCDNDKR